MLAVFDSCWPRRWQSPCGQGSHRQARLSQECSGIARNALSAGFLAEPQHRIRVVRPMCSRLGRADRANRVCRICWSFEIIDPHGRIDDHHCARVLTASRPYRARFKWEIRFKRPTSAWPVLRSVQCLRPRCEVAILVEKARSRAYHRRSPSDPTPQSLAQRLAWPSNCTVRRMAVLNRGLFCVFPRWYAAIARRSNASSISMLVRMSLSVCGKLRVVPIPL